MNGTRKGPAYILYTRAKNSCACARTLRNGLNDFTETLLPPGRVLPSPPSHQPPPSVTGAIDLRETRSLHHHHHGRPSHLFLDRTLAYRHYHPYHPLASCHHLIGCFKQAARRRYGRGGSKWQCVRVHIYISFPPINFPAKRMNGKTSPASYYNNIVLVARKGFF